jgi:hypothetical protein
VLEDAVRIHTDVGLPSGHAARPEGLLPSF